MTTKETSRKVGFQAKHIRKLFAGTPALSDVSFAVHPGEIVGLVGHNGAGKSTLLKTLAGVHQPDGGSLNIDGKEVSFSSPAVALDHGVATVYQELSLLPNLTVTQNVWLGRELTATGTLSKNAMAKAAAELMKQFRLNVEVDQLVGAYPVAIRQLMEIAIATSKKDVKYLLLDEPTTALEGSQVDDLLHYIKDLAETQGLGIVIVDHKLDELYQVCDRIVALVDGEVVFDAPVAELSHGEVVAAIAGENAVVTDDGSAAGGDQQTSFGEELLTIENLTTKVLTGLSLKVRAGEVLGLYGLVGAGRTELLRTLIGLDPVLSGKIMIAGQRYQPKNPRHAMNHGLVYVTEERKTDGIVPKMNSIFNSALPVLQRYARFGWLSPARVKKDMAQALSELQIRGNINNPIASLSGGNQQKVLLARAIAQQPRILMVDEPTKGVDIGVKTEIHRIFRKMAAEQNIAVIVVSSEEEEVLEVADTVMVIANGKEVGVAKPASQYTISELRTASWQG